MHENSIQASHKYLKPFMMSLGIVFDLGETHLASWTGKCFTRLNRASDACHELAHWLICPLDRRELPEFGLGPIPVRVGNPRYRHIKRVVSSKTAWNEDMEALVLGFAYFRFFRFDVENYIKEMLYQNRHKKFVFLFETHVSAFYAAVERLQTKKFLDADLNPLVVSTRKT